VIRFTANFGSFESPLPKFENALSVVANKELLLGVVHDHRNDSGLTNSQLLAIHEFGAPEVKIPARPIIGPVLLKNSDAIGKTYLSAIDHYLAGNNELALAELHALGIYLVSQCKKRILDHIPPPLKLQTLQKRRVKGNFDDTPLKDTTQLLHSIGYTIVDRNISQPTVSAPTVTTKRSLWQRFKGMFGF